MSPRPFSFDFGTFTIKPVSELLIDQFRNLLKSFSQNATNSEAVDHQSVHPGMATRIGYIVRSPIQEDEFA